MIGRYTLPEMGGIWTEEARFDAMLRVEIAACEALAETGEVPADDLEQIKTKAAFDVDSIREIEKTTNHDVVAFVTDVARRIGPAGRHIHRGLTSSDVLDTALGLQLVQASDRLLGRLETLADILKRRALEHRDTVTIGRTHGVHAEPTTFGVKLALFYTEVRRHTERLRHARGEVAVGKLSGAVGTFAHLDPAIEEAVCRKLGLAPAPVASQVVQRDRHAHFVGVLAGIAASLGKFATEIRHLQRTEVREAEEFFDEKGQTGSSAMPHKRNPILSERICGLARVVAGYAQTALANVPLWHERDISHSSAERVILPDACIAVDYMLVKSAGLFEKLVVHADRMKGNLEGTGGLWASQSVLLELNRAGLPRETAYRIVQRNAMKAWKGEGSFRELLAADADLAGKVDPAALEACFDLSRHLRHVGTLFARAGIEETRAIEPGAAS